MADEGKLDPAIIAALYMDHSEPLRRFLLGVLQDASLAGDVLQATFAKAVELGHTTRPESRKAWLFRVAYHEAMAVRRRQAVGRRAMEKVAWVTPGQGGSADEPLVRLETVRAVRLAIDDLPTEQRQVVQMRVYEEKKFVTIAEELGIPLGTALARMRSALKKLRGKLDEENI